MESAREKLRAGLLKCPAYPILDTTTLAIHGADEWLDTVLSSGVRIVQLRLKNANEAYFQYVARKFIAKCNEFSAVSILNDRLDIALTLGAGGVHLGLADALIMDARAAAIRKLGVHTSFIIGGSARTVDHARSLADAGATYLGCGACYQTQTKDDTVHIGVARLTEIAKSVRIPIVGIGGVNWGNFHEVLLAGALGFAAISMFLHPLDEIESHLDKLNSGKR